MKISLYILYVWSRSFFYSYIDITVNRLLRNLCLTIFFRLCFIKNNIKLLSLTLSWRRSFLYRNQSIDLDSKSVDWFLYLGIFMKELILNDYYVTSMSSTLSACASKIKNRLKWKLRNSWLCGGKKSTFLILHFFITNGCAHRTKYSRMDQNKFVEDSLLKKLLGPFLNTLSHMYTTKEHKQQLSPETKYS